VFIIPSKSFPKFFQTFFLDSPFKGSHPGKIVVNIARTPPPRELAVPSSRLPRSVLAGAKIRQTLSLFQIFYPLFYKIFLSSLVLNRLHPRIPPRIRDGRREEARE
ncbi:hypothetical protein DXC42_06295, partial [Butyricimonas virosa]